MLGFLKNTADGLRIDHDPVARLLACAPNLKAPFDRAFEELTDPLGAIAELKRHPQIDCILSRGKGEPWVAEIDRFVEWERAARPEIGMLVGGGTDAEAIKIFCKSSSIRAFHLGRAVREGERTDGAVLETRVREIAMPTKESFCLNPASFDLEYGVASHPGSHLFFDGRFAVMTTEDFIARHAKPIAALWKTVAERRGVTNREFAERLAAIFAREGNGARAHNSSNPGDADEARDFISNIRAGELCLAIACEKGDEGAWLAFEAEYRHSMQGAARALTKDEAEAEDLIQFVFGELYGVRMDGDRRLSKLAHYSGRGSLGGWLRAVIYQAFIDRKRQTARFEQVEEIAEFDRLANEAAASVNGRLSSPIVQPDDIEDTRLRQATEEAITQAFTEIEARDRLLLNYYYFDDLTLREIGLMMGVHEATISRWLAKAQREVKRKTEEILQRSYGLRRAEVAECLQIAARTELDVRKLITD